MIDPINAATDLTKKAAISAAKGVANNAKGAAIAAAAAAVPPVVGVVAEKLKKLPTTKDPELVKQQVKAEAQKLKGELESKLQQEKDKKIEELKDKASILAPLAAVGTALFLKLPVLDPKILATLAFLKAQQEFRELKQKVSKENLKKAKENFTFPMKPPTSLSGLPKIPEVPKIPDIPKIPAVPNVSQLKNATTATSPSSNPSPTQITIPPGISPEDWKRFGDPDTLSFGPESAAKTVAARKAVRRAEIIKIQENRVRKAKEFVDRQAQRLASDASLQSSYDNAVKVYNQRVSYLQTVRNNPSIVDLTE